MAVRNRFEVVCVMLIEVRVIEVMFSQYRNGWESVLKMLIWAYLNSTAVIVF